VVVVAEAAPVSVTVTPASGAPGRRGRASPPPPLVDTFPEMLNVPPPPPQEEYLNEPIRVSHPAELVVA
jgi:hypothetical protein